MSDPLFFTSVTRGENGRALIFLFHVNRFSSELAFIRGAGANPLESLILTWLTAVLFVMMMFWGVNVPTERRSSVVYVVIILVALFNLFAQAYLFSSRSPMGSGPAALEAADMAVSRFNGFLNRMALVPGGLRGAAPGEWYRLVTSSLLHYGWLHLIFNVWFFALFGHVLERVLGVKKFVAIVAAGLIIPAALDGWLPFFTDKTDGFTGGFSGVVYAVMGAYLVCFPRSRCYGAFNYDLRYWAVILFIMVPVTMVTRYAGLALTEMIIVLGMVGVYLLMQPEHVRLSAPVLAVIMYKLVQDVALIEPVAGEVIANSFWRIGGGFFVGVAGGLILNGNKGWKLTWDDETKAKASAKRTGGRTSVAQLEAEGHKTAEGARVYLGQRVFIGDSAKAAAFYREVVIPKFPDLSLPLQEQMALARMLHFKGCEAEAMHAYEIVLHTDPLPEEYWVAWLKAAEHVAKLAPHRSADARRYLDKFEEGHNILMRDRIEAERIRAELPVVESAAFGVDEESVGSVEDAGAENTEVTEAGVYPGATEVAAGNNDNGVSQAAAPQLEFPKITPRTFRYVAGETVVSLGMTNSKQKEADSLSSEDPIKSYWEPLPCLSENKTLPSILDRPVKNPRVAAEEENKPSMYGPPSGGRGRRAGGGRLSKLELVRKDIGIRVPRSGEQASRYGGLSEAQVETGEQPTLRLRGEKDLPERGGRRRERLRRQPASPGGVVWENALTPGEQMPEDRDGYGM